MKAGCNKIFVLFLIDKQGIKEFLFASVEVNSVKITENCILHNVQNDLCFNVSHFQSPLKCQHEYRRGDGAVWGCGHIPPKTREGED